MRNFDNHPIELMRPESNCSWSQRALFDSVGDHGEEGSRTWHAHRARRGLNGLRIDTAKYVSPTYLEWLGNAIREWPNTIGIAKKIPFDEIYTNEETIANSGATTITPAAFG